jgi:NMD protein affecting ribosome stability and mRNA decay
MRFISDCQDCQRLSGEYEAATMEWFRVQGQLRVAEYSRDEDSTTRIIAELSQIASRRHALRDEAEKHEIEMHPRTAVAGWIY